MFKKRYVLDFIEIVLVLLFFLFAVQKGFALDTNTLSLWQDTMKYGISKQRIAVIKSIVDNKVTNAFGLVEDALTKDSNPNVRGEAAYALTSLENKKQSLWLSALSQESNSEVLRRVVAGINELKIDGTGPRLYVIMTNKIKDPKEDQLTAAVIRAIGEVKYKPAADYILSALTNIENSIMIRSAAAVSIGDLGNAQQLAVLETLVHDPGENKGVRMYSAYAMGKSGESKVTAVLYPIIEDENEDINIRLWAIAGLAYVKDATIVDKMIEFAKVDHKAIRMEAIKTLGKIKDKRAEEILKFKALYDPELEVKKEAKKALQEMGIDVENLGKEKTATKEEKQNS